MVADKMLMPVPGSRGGAAEGVIILDPTFRLVAADEGGEAIVQMLKGERSADAVSPTLPPAIQKHLAGKSPHDLIAARLWVETVDSQYSCRVFWMEPHNGFHSGPLLAVHLKREQSLSDAARRVGRAYHLTEREEEAVVGIAMGLTSKELAARMSISPNTVNTFLRMIMVKMGVTTRAGVVGKLLAERGQQKRN